MCVPFGKILRGNAIPNTVTKTIHTDKVFAQDLRSFTIENFPATPRWRARSAPSTPSAGR